MTPTNRKLLRRAAQALNDTRSADTDTVWEVANGCLAIMDELDAKDAALAEARRTLRNIAPYCIHVEYQELCGCSTRMSEQAKAWLIRHGGERE